MVKNFTDEHDVFILNIEGMHFDDAVDIKVYDQVRKIANATELFNKDVLTALRHLLLSVGYSKVKFHIKETSLRVTGKRIETSMEERIRSKRALLVVQKEKEAQGD
jgi:hypothetical protein